MSELDLHDVRALEDLVIGTVYSGLLICKLDQRASVVRVVETVGRDVRLEEIGDLIQTLTELQNSTERLHESVKSSSHVISRGRDNDKSCEFILQEQVHAAKASIKVKKLK